MATHTPFCWPSMRQTFSPSTSSTFSSMPAAMAPYLRRGIGVAHNETGTYRPVKPRKVERYNILTLFIFNRTNDSFDQFIHK